MWAIVKINRNELSFLKNDFKKKLGNGLHLYSPKMLLNISKKNKYIKKEFNLMGDYLFCFHKKFHDPKIIQSLKYVKGLKYFLKGFEKSQNEISEFIKRCRKSEDHKGYVTQTFFKLYYKTTYKFSSGPFVNMIFKIIDLQQDKINILVGNLKTSLKKNKYLFTQV